MFEFKSYASGSSGNVNSLFDGTTRVLIDMGLPIKKIRKCVDFSLVDVDFAILTHSHKDHSKGAKDLMTKGVDCYMAEDTASSLGLSGHRLKTFKELEPFTIGSFKVLPFPLQHDVPNYGFLIQSTITKEKLLYVTDTEYCSYKFKDVNIIAVECNYDREILDSKVESEHYVPALAHRVITNHFELKNVLKFLKANKSDKLDKVYLLHLSNSNSNEKAFILEAQKVVGVPVYTGG